MTQRCLEVISVIYLSENVALCYPSSFSELLRGMSVFLRLTDKARANYIYMRCYNNICTLHIVSQVSLVSQFVSHFRENFNVLLNFCRLLFRLPFAKSEFLQWAHLIVRENSLVLFSHYKLSSNPPRPRQPNATKGSS